ncbi:hypothetical protein CRUP_030665 [Coryphaenoides rupestris]|nr:hypothetical protein CRUP_030665 [Coryphaenoides rupestris]
MPLISVEVGEEKQRMMQRVLSHKALRQVAALRGASAAGLSASERPTRLCCLLLSPSLAAATASGSSHRWLGVSAPGRAAQHPKQQPDEKEPLSPPPAPSSQESPAPHATSSQESPPPHAPSSQEKPAPSQGESPEVDPLQDNSIGLIQRFKKTFKQYGKVMIPVHLVTSSVWFGTFYYAAMKYVDLPGANVGPVLEYIGLPDSIVGLLGDSSSGYALTAYAMYKLATPARYTVTLGGTSFSVQYLRRHGYFSTPPPVKDYLQDRMEETKERLTEKMEETKGRLTEKMEETKDRFSERMEETKDKFSERMEETKDKFSEKLQETKDKVSEGKTFFRKKTD